MFDQIIEKEKNEGPFEPPIKVFNRLAVRQSLLRYLVRDCKIDKIDALIIAEDSIARAEHLAHMSL